MFCDWIQSSDTVLPLTAYEKPTPAGCSRKRTDETVVQAYGLSTIMGMPALSRSPVKVKGPSSVRKPSRDEQPGPPVERVSDRHGQSG